MTQNHRLLKDQRQREKLTPKPGHSLEEIDYKKQNKNKKVSVHEGTWKSSLSLYKTKYSSFKIFRWPADSEPPSAAVHSRGCSNSVGGGLCGQLTSPSASLDTQHKCSKMSLRTGDLT